MQVSVESVSALERRVTIGVPAANVDDAVEARLKDAQKTVRINGFRKGKVPLKVVKQRYGAGVRQEVIGEVMSRSFYEAVAQENLKPAGQPSIEPKEMAEGKDLEFVATFEVYPEIEVADLGKISVEKPEASIEDKDVDNMIETLRKQQAAYEPIKRKRMARKDDQVNIDFEGTKDGEPFEGGKGENHDLVLGSNTMIPGFEDGIIGMKPEEEKVLELTFPEDYHAEELKGAAVEFKVKVNGIKTQTLPELNDEFFAKFGVTEGGEAKFREDVQANMERELKNAAKNKVKTQVMDGLRELHQVELPGALVDGEINAMRQQMVQQFGGQAQNLDLNQLLPAEMFKEQAEQRVALGLIVAEVIKSADLKVDDERVQAQIEEMASTYEQPEDVIKYYNENQQLLQQVQSLVLEDQVVDYVLDKAKVKTVKASYDEVIKQPGEGA